jgi:DNA topoisomerase VI subunit B
MSENIEELVEWFKTINIINPETNQRNEITPDIIENHLRTVKENKLAD